MNIMINEDFQKVLDEYLQAREENGYTSAPIAHHIQQTLKNEIADLVDNPNYKVTASAGVGRLSEIPWIGVFNPEQNDNISSGYFFKADMSGVYLVLRAFYQEELEKKYGKYLPEYLKTKTKHITDLLENSSLDINSFDESFDLNSNHKTADIHKNGIILCKLYEKNNIPSEDILINDLKRIMKIQEYIYENYSDDMYLSVDEWIEALEDETLVDSKMLNVLEIMYNSEEYTSCFKDIAKQRGEIGFTDEKVYTTNVTNTSKRLKEHFNKTALYNKDGAEEYWSRLFYGKFKKHKEGQRLFYMTLREELIQALEKYDRSKRPDRIEMDILTKNSTSPENKIDSESNRYWIISAGEDSIWWDDFKQNNEIGINFPGTKDILQYKTPDEIRRDLQEANGDESSYKNIVNACWQFAHDMKIGDVVFVKHGNSTIIGRGIIESDYKYDSSKPYPKFRKINWTHIKGNWRYDGTLPQKTLTDITDKSYLEIIKKFFEDKKFDSFQDYLIYEGYYFSSETIENYLLSLKVKPFIILTGNSGTGKTKLSQLFAEYLYKKHSEYKSKNNHEVVPVGANWTENRNIVGYYNVLTKSYQHTQSLDLLLNAEKDTDYPYFLILDEMNLSHVERYFSDFLSAMESGEKIPLHKDSDKLKEDHVPENLKIASNIFIVGTVNIDETTYMFSPKVLDRSNVLEFKTFEDISIEDYINKKSYDIKLEGNVDYLENPLSDRNLRKNILSKIHDGFDQANFEISIITLAEDGGESEETIVRETGNVLKSIASELNNFNEILNDSGFEFGYRTVNEILAFMVVALKYEKGENYEGNWDNWNRYFDAQILQKVLPKLHGSQMVLGETLDNLLVYCLDIDSSDDCPELEDIDNSYPYPESAKKLLQMKEVLEKQRYVSFIN